MDALSGLTRIAECLFAQLMSYFPLFAVSISSCKGGLNQRIPVEPDSGKNWMVHSVIVVKAIVVC